jgi:hypothetical protein
MQIGGVSDIPVQRHRGRSHGAGNRANAKGFKPVLADEFNAGSKNGWTIER